MITLKQLNHLQAICHHRTIFNAAEELHLSQSALSRSILTLEESLGVQLLDRAKTGVTPTAFCEQIMAQCQQALLAVSDIEWEAEIYRNIQGGRLRIAIGRAIKQMLLREALPEFLAKFPKLSVNISDGTPEDLVYQLKNRKVDMLLAGMASYRNFDGIVYEHIKDMPLSIFVRRGHPLSKQSAVAPADLWEYPSAAAQTLYRGAGLHPIQKSLPGFSGITSLVCSDYQVLKEVVLKTDTWLIAPSGMLQEEISSGQIFSLHLKTEKMVIELSVIELAGRSRSPAAEHFIRLCKSKFI